jgi:hypothetical protein
MRGLSGKLGSWVWQQQFFWETSQRYAYSDFANRATPISETSDFPLAFQTH